MDKRIARARRHISSGARSARNRTFHPVRGAGAFTRTPTIQREHVPRGWLLRRHAHPLPSERRRTTQRSIEIVGACLDFPCSE
ncbi:hypothetical protein [Burkholderia singularis]|uniref:hypothetical protein n=1 Tax=Burkholderia singularis TaxID=1503053 RepID=UPI00117F3A97|nr:hypothetical protein [Burkholderia singularis]